MTVQKEFYTYTSIFLHEQVKLLCIIQPLLMIITVDSKGIPPGFQYFI